MNSRRLIGFLEAQDDACVAQQQAPAPPLVNQLNNGNWLPQKEAEALRDELFYQRAIHAYVTMLPALNTIGMRDGSEAVFGKGYNVLPIWKDRMDARTWVPTPNADVIYSMNYLDLKETGPLVVAAPRDVMTEPVVRTGTVRAPTLRQMEGLNMDRAAPILIRIYKEENTLEVWKQDRTGKFALLKSYPICKFSGKLGPKIMQGDHQAPEGFYDITPAQMNPNSSQYLAFNVGFPNAFDRSLGRTGSFLMVHGGCSSVGCYAMTDYQMEEIYGLVDEAFKGGQDKIQLAAFPFRMTTQNLARHADNPNVPFWEMLKSGDDAFFATERPPSVAVCDQRYVFNPIVPDNLDPNAPCPPGVTTNVARARQSPAKLLVSLQAQPEPPPTAAFATAAVRNFR